MQYVFIAVWTLVGNWASRVKHLLARNGTPWTTPIKLGSQPSESVSNPAPELAVSISQPEVASTRATRRAMASNERKLLKARKKFDKFVEPKGPKPVKHERDSIPKPEKRPKVEEPLPQLPADDPNQFYCADYYDGDKNNPKVLYEETEFTGQFNFRDTILDQLNRYWFYLDDMKKNDPESYTFYRQVGMQIVPYMTHMLFGNEYGKGKLTVKELVEYKKDIFLPPVFNTTRPSFGCIAVGANPKVENWERDSKYMWPRFIYYTKYKMPPPQIQMMAGGDIYKMTIWWHTEHMKHGRPQEFAMFISKDGQHLQVLKTCETRMIPIKSKGKSHDGDHSFRIPDHSWRIPHDYELWAKQWGINVQLHLTHLFTNAVQKQENAQFGDVRVAVQKDNMTALFNIDSRRLSYFFQDRDYELTVDGRRKRIFHIVRPQVRKDGSTVRMHYRGEKEFTWAGYRVVITVPGLDHFVQSDLNVGSVDEYWLEKRKDWLDEDKFAKWVNRAIDEGIGGHDPTGAPST